MKQDRLIIKIVLVLVTMACLEASVLCSVCRDGWHMMLGTDKWPAKWTVQEAVGARTQAARAPSTVAYTEIVDTILLCINTIRQRRKGM